MQLFPLLSFVETKLLTITLLRLYTYINFQAKMQQVIEDNTYQDGKRFVIHELIINYTCPSCSNDLRKIKLLEDATIEQKISFIGAQINQRLFVSQQFQHFDLILNFLKLNQIGKCTLVLKVLQDGKKQKILLQEVSIAQIEQQMQKFVKVCLGVKDPHRNCKYYTDVNKQAFQYLKDEATILNQVCMAYQKTLKAIQRAYEATIQENPQYINYFASKRQCKQHNINEQLNITLINRYFERTHKIFKKIYQNFANPKLDLKYLILQQFEILNQLTKGQMIQSIQESSQSQFNILYFIFICRYIFHLQNQRKNNEFSGHIQQFSYLAQLMDYVRQPSPYTKMVCKFIAHHLHIIFKEVLQLHQLMIKENHEFEYFIQGFHKWKNQKKQQEELQKDNIYNLFKQVISKSWINLFQQILKFILDSTQHHPSNSHQAKYFSVTRDNLGIFFYQRKLQSMIYNRISRYPIDVKYLEAFIREKQEKFQNELNQLKVQKAKHLDYVIMKKMLLLINAYAQIIILSQGKYASSQFCENVEAIILRKIEEFKKEYQKPILDQWKSSYQLRIKDIERECDSAQNLLVQVKMKFQSLQQWQLIAFIERITYINQKRSKCYKIKKLEANTPNL